MNDAFESSGSDDEVLSHFKDEDRLTPLRIVELAGEIRERVSDSSDRLTSAGRIRKLARRLYEYVDGPRE